MASSDTILIQQRRGRAARRWFLCLLCLVAGTAAVDRAIGADSQRANKRVLVISTGSRFSTGFPLAEQSALESLRQHYQGGLEFYSESLDIVRFPRDSYHRVFRDYLRDKYADDLPDIILLLYVGNLSLAESLLGQLFPDTPVVAAGLTEEEFPSGWLFERGSGVAQRSDPAGTIKLLLQLQPDIRQLILIGGTAEVDRQVMERAHQSARLFAGRLQVEVWNRRSMPDMLERVTSLPPRTAILFTRLYRDGAGGAYASAQAAQSIAKVANVPVYVMSDPMLGTGAVGGSVADVAALGKRAGDLAERILSGADPRSMPLEILTKGMPIFDWRALRRWGISESRLPQDSIVRFRPPSIWDEYHWYIIAALAVFSLQAGLITSLVVTRLKRRQVENELRQNQELLEMATRTSGLGLWARDLDDDAVWVNSVLRKQLGLGPNEAARAGEILERIHPEDRSRVIAQVERAQETNTPFEDEFRAKFVDGREGWVLAKAGTVNLPDRRGSHRMGVLLDITERKKMEEALRDSEENFRRLVETTAAVLWQANMETWQFTYVTPQAVKLLGYPLEQWYEKDFWTSHIHPDDRELALNTCLTKCQTGEDFDFEYRMVKLSGEVVWVHDFVNCLRQPGERAHIRGLMLDVTERKLSEQALRESEERFRTVANSAPVMIWMAGTDKRCSFFNKGWLDFTGRTLEQELGYGWRQGVHPEDLDRFLAVYGNSFDARREYALEYRLRRNDGEFCWVFYRGVPLFETDGTFLGYVGTATDLSEIKRGDEKFQLAVEASSNATVMVNETGEIILVNQQTEKLFGYSREELIGHSVEILVPERFRFAHPELRRQFFAAPQARELGAGRDLCARRKDGSEMLVEIGLTPIRAHEGWLVLAAIVDISARRQAEEALKKERAFLRQVIDITPNFIFAKDREGHFTLANRALADAYGTTVENLIGKTDANFNPNQDEVGFFNQIDREVIDTLQERFIPEEYITDAQGKLRWLQTVKRPIIGADGSADQVLGASTDITQRKSTEADAQRLRDELAHMTRVSTLGELAASLAHELNQPLTAILSNAQAAQRFLTGSNADLDEVSEILKDIVQDDNRASQVIQRMRALIKKEDIMFAPLDLPSLINDVLQLLHSDAVLHNVRVTLESDPGLPPVRGDKVQLQQVMLNLLLNAFDAMAHCPVGERAVAVRAQREGTEKIKVAVCDHGPGLAGDKLEKIFHPFYTTKRTGLGMGLSISRSIAEAHGGRLWVENNSERGATFFFTLPAAREPSAE